jgi:hypothetical protein
MVQLDRNDSNAELVTRRILEPQIQNPKCVMITRLQTTSTRLQQSGTYEDEFTVNVLLDQRKALYNDHQLKFDDLLKVMPVEAKLNSPTRRTTFLVKSRSAEFFQSLIWMSTEMETRRPYNKEHRRETDCNSTGRISLVGPSTLWILRTATSARRH